MRSKKIFSVLTMAALVGFFGAASLLAQEKATTPDSAIIKLKPDIIIQSITITRTGIAADGSHLVSIAVVVKNLVATAATGPFKVKVEWTENPTLGWNYLAEGGVANLGSSDPAIGVIKITATLNFDHKVPLGKAYKYKATGDYLNVVVEKDETNNVNAAGYIAR